MKDTSADLHDQPDDSLIDKLRVAMDQTRTIDLDLESAPAQVTIEGYDIAGIVSQGGQGVVYGAIQESTKQQVAIKVLVSGRHTSRTEYRRFQREIEVAAGLQHPNIISIFTSGLTDEGLPYFVMDYVHGLPLDVYVRQNELGLEEVLALFADICGAVQAAHVHGIIHRDLKPSNILVDNEGRPRILDFGLAKAIDEPAEALITQTNRVVGTLGYLSPQQASGRRDGIDHRTDVYSLGVNLYHLLTGRFPYPITGEVHQVLRNVEIMPPTPPTRMWSPDSGVRARRGSGSVNACPIDHDVQTIILKTLAKDPERRYTTAGELEADLRRYLAGEPIVARGDSLGYILTTRSRRLVQRHHITSFALVVLASVLISRFIGAPLVIAWTPLTRSWNNWLSQSAAPPGTRSSLQDVRVVGFSDNAQLEAIAVREGVPGITRSVPKSLRRLHGHFMKHLASSRCRAVVWDITFKGETEYDAEFAEGVAALRGAGIEVVVAVPDWRLVDGVPAVSETLVNAGVRWGGVTVQLMDSPATAALVARQRLDDPLVALSLAGVVAARRPGEEAEFELDLDEQALNVIYYQQNPKLDAVRSITVTETLKLSKIYPATEENAAPLNLDEGDLLGYYYFMLPSDACLSASTIAYEDVFDAHESQLRESFEDKVVVVGDLRPGTDRHEAAGGREIPGCYAHAAVIDRLLPLTAICNPRVEGEYAVHILAALLGGMVGVMAATRSRKRCALIVVVSVGCFLCSGILYARSEYLLSPFVAIFGVIVAAELAAAVRRIHISHRLDTA